MNCATVERYADAVLDGEVDASARMELEKHLTACGCCRERLEFAGWLKQRLRSQGQVKAPAELRERVSCALQQESEPLGRIDASWGSTLVFAAAAVLIFGLGGVVEYRGPAVQAGMATVLEDVVRAHVRAYPAEVARRDQVPTYFSKKVGFAVKPVEFADPGVRFVGARRTEVGGRKAVTLRYEARGRRMTVVAFRPPERTGDFGEQIETDGRVLRYVRVKGHTVPLVEHDGVLYAVVGDMDPEDELRMAARASLQ